MRHLTSILNKKEENKDMEPAIVIKIGDWVDEANQYEIIIRNKQDLIDFMIKHKLPVSLMAKLGLVARERGEAPEELFSPNKFLLLQHAAHEISQYVASQRENVELSNGKVIDVHAYVSTDNLSEDEELEVESLQEVPRYLKPTDSESPEAARKHLMINVRSRINEKLKIIAAGGGDVIGVAEELKAVIDSLVERLV